MDTINKKIKELKDIITKEVLSYKDQERIVSRSGNESNWLFDFRKILLKPKYLNLVAEIFWEKYKDKYPFQIGGLEVAAIPLIAAIVMKSVEKGKPVNGFFIRKSRKKDGLMKMIEGVITDDPIILVDDIINSGKTFIRQLEILDALEKNVSEIFILLNFRELNGYNFAKKRNVIITSLFELPVFGKDYIKTKTSNPKDNFNTKWYFKSENPNYFYVVPKSTPVLDKEKIYFGSDGGNFWALNQEDGSVAWKYKVGWHAKGKSIFSAPALHNGTVFFGAYDGNVYALDTATGKKKWIFYEADWVGSSPTLAPKLNSLFIGLEFGLFKKKGGVVAIDIETGKKKWEYIMPKYTHCSPAYLASENVIAIGSNDSKMYLFNAKNGKLLWEFQAGGEMKASPIFDEKRNQLLFGSHDGNLYILDIKTGKLIFKYQTKFAIYSTPIIHKNAVYFSSLDKYLYSLNLNTHKLNWMFGTNGRVFASPEVIEGKVYIGSNDGRLYEIDTETGKELSFFQAVERITNKVVYNKETKRFFVLTFANEIYCLTKKKVGELVK